MSFKNDFDQWWDHKPGPGQYIVFLLIILALLVFGVSALTTLVGG